MSTFVTRHLRCLFGILLFTSLSVPTVDAADSGMRVFGSLALQNKSLSFTLADIPVDSSQTAYNFSIGVARGPFYLLAETEQPFSQDISVIRAPYPGPRLQHRLQAEQLSIQG